MLGTRKQFFLKITQYESLLHTHNHHSEKSKTYSNAWSKSFKNKYVKQKKVYESE